jgi:hypothetical protein
MATAAQSGLGLAIFKEGEMQWYYMAGNNRQGPVAQEEIHGLIASGNISRETFVWKQGMADWLPAGETELATLFSSEPSQAPPAPAQRKIYPLPNPASLNKLWLLTIILNSIGLGLIVLGSVMTAGANSDVAITGGGFAVVGMLVFVFAVVFECILLHKLWCPIQDGQARTTPGKAVGFMFIPFFNLYWSFQAFWGLSKDMNAYAAQRGVAAPQINEALGLAICILLCVQTALGFFAALVTVVTHALSIVALVLNIVFWKQVVNAASAIVIAKTKA